MNRKADKTWFGLLLGLLMPLVVMFFFYVSKYSGLSLEEFVDRLIDKAVFLKVLSLCAFVNLALFFLFYKTKNDRAARGVIWATAILAGITIINQLMTGSI